MVNVQECVYTGRTGVESTWRKDWYCTDCAGVGAVTLLQIGGLWRVHVSFRDNWVFSSNHRRQHLRSRVPAEWIVTPYSYVTCCTLWRGGKQNWWMAIRPSVALTLSRPVVIHNMYSQFRVVKFYVPPTQCIYVFCVDLRTAIISLYNINWRDFRRIGKIAKNDYKLPSVR